MAKQKDIESVVCNAIDAYHKDHPELRVKTILCALEKIESVLFNTLCETKIHNPKFKTWIN